MRRDIGGGKGKGHQGTCIKDPWTKPKSVGSRVGSRDGWGRGAWWETTVLEQQLKILKKKEREGY